MNHHDYMSQPHISNVGCLQYMRQDFITLMKWAADISILELSENTVNRVYYLIQIGSVFV